MRALESCPFRESVPEGRDGATASCRLLREITGLDDGLCLVRDDACRACCAAPVPSSGRINPVVASLLARIADEVISAGGLPGCAPTRAHAVRRRALHSLQVVLTAGGGGRPDRLFERGPDAISVAVVIPCHNYGRFLAEAIESALAQSGPVAEIVVVDDSSTDNTESVARRYEGAGVRYVRVEVRSVFQARRAGFEATGSEVVCFLDADDVLPTEYVERGLPHFHDPRIGIVYSDIETFGDQEDRHVYPAFDPAALELGNYLHAGSLVRRRALEVADAFRDAVLDESHADWFLWRRVVEAGWQAIKQDAVYRYRRHAAAMLIRRGAGGPFPDEFYERAALSEAEVTIFTPFSGRAPLWPAYRDWLLAQRWPRGQCRLVFMDTSGDPAFGRVLRGFLAECDYPDTRYSAGVVGEPGLADKPRRLFADGVRLACARIYNRMARDVTTPFVLVVEDDILPPPDAIERLLRGMDAKTAAVSGAYLSRFTGAHVLWDDQGEHLPPGEGHQAVGGSGFGCILLRRAVVAHETFHFGFADSPDYDRAFSRRLRENRWTIKVAWDVACGHRESRGRAEGDEGSQI